MFKINFLIYFFRGLTVTTVLINLLKVYCEAGNLVLVLGALPSEEEYFVSQLADAGIKPLPKIITNEYGTNERFKEFNLIRYSTFF